MNEGLEAADGVGGGDPFDSIAFAISLRAGCLDSDSAGEGVVEALELELEGKFVAPTPEGHAGEVQTQGDFGDGEAVGEEACGGELARAEE